MAFENHKTSLAEDFPALAQYFIDAEACRKTDEKRGSNGGLVLLDRMGLLVENLSPNGVSAPAVLKTRTADIDRLDAMRAEVKNLEDCFDRGHVLELQTPLAFDVEQALLGFSARVRKALFDPRSGCGAPISSEILDVVPDDGDVVRDIGRLVEAINRRSGTLKHFMLEGWQNGIIFGGETPEVYEKEEEDDDGDPYFDGI